MTSALCGHKLIDSDANWPAAMSSARMSPTSSTPLQRRTSTSSRALSSRAAASPRPRIGRTSPSTPGSPLPGPQLPSKRPARADLFTVPTVRHAFDLAARASLQCLLRDAKASADVNSVDKAGNTPLHIAAEADSYDIVRFLLDNGASVDAISNEVSPAPRRGASRRGHTAATVRTTVAGSA